MTEEQTIKLLNLLGVQVTKTLYSNSKGTDLIACCPFHGERHPSFAVNVEKGVYNCFACDAHGTLVRMVSELKGCSLTEAYSIIEEFDSVDKRTVHTKEVRRYGESSEMEFRGEASRENNNTVHPMSKIAPFRSGKVSIEYLHKRGFHQSTLQCFRIGWNRVTNRITIPIFSRRGELWGWSERTVFDKTDPEYSPLYGESDKYMIHEFSKSRVLFPLNLFQPLDDSVILVEGLLDAIWMHQLGFTNTLSIITANINPYQVNLLRTLKVRKVIAFLDFDSAGEKGRKKLSTLLGNEFVLYDVENVVDKKDPQEMTKEEIEQVLSTQHLLKVSKSVKHIS